MKRLPLLLGEFWLTVKSMPKLPLTSMRGQDFTHNEPNECPIAKHHLTLGKFGSRPLGLRLTYLFFKMKIVSIITLLSEGF